jgi:hypothetical protein
MDKYIPTSAVLDNIQRGYVLKQKYQRNSQAAQTNNELINKAKLKFDSGVDLTLVKEMYSVLTKLEKAVDFRQKASDGGPNEDAIKFYAFGGSAGLAWSRMILKQEDILKSYKKEITKAETEATGNDSVGKIQVAKAVNDELMQATFVVMVPDEIDAHGDTTTEEEVRKACHNFNKYSLQANLFHLAKTDTFEFAESYVCPTEFVLGDKLVKKGTWLCTVQCLDDSLWELIKSGEINGVSIGALAAVETIETIE